MARTPARPVDYRLVLLGAILPDLIDKPLGFVLGLESRLWGHTLLILFSLIVASFAPPLRAVRLIGFGVATHLLLDEIWIMPTVALYPAYGWWFPSTPFAPEHWIEALLHDPVVQAGEVLGFSILLAVAWTQGIRSWAAFRAFLGHGSLPGAARSRP